MKAFADLPEHVLRANVLRGIRWLDRWIPRWMGYVSTSTLDVSMASKCILGQLSDSPIGAKTPLNNRLITVTWAVEYGFYLNGRKQYADLTRIWVEEIERKRREHNRIAASSRC